MKRGFAYAAVFTCLSWCALRPASLMASSSAVVQAHIRISVCGNALDEGGEDCDGADLDGRTCRSLGFTGGRLSCGIDCSFDTTRCVNGSSQRGGGGGSPPNPIILPVVTQVIFIGQAYPSSRVTLLKDGQIAATAIADGSGTFTATLTGLSEGPYQFSLSAVDARGRQSAALSFPLQVSAGLVTKVNQILIAPTIETADAGDGLLTVQGQSLPNASIYDAVDRQEDARVVTVSDAGGNYLFQLDTASLAEGPHDLSVKGTAGTVATASSAKASFTVTKKPPEIGIPGKVQSDVNGDGRINLVDFSVMAFWYGASSQPPAHADLNGDGKVDLTDFSILAYYWTG